ncbi:MAG: family 20 glycosylhydrolase, partial [Cellulomonadaceae bacterium]
MSVLPAPRSIESRGPRVPVPPTLPGDLARSLEPWAPRAAALLRRAVPDLGLAATSAGPRATITTALDTTLPAEHYRLDLQPTWWAVQAGDEAGAYWAVQTLLQLLDADGTFVPAIVADGPAYPVRGFMIDLVRHFFGVPELKHLIDLVSTYKANRLHLHLTDDQGWRLEMTSRPALTQRAAATAVGGDAGGFLTIADYENLQRYATERHLEIVPEIDLPGHSHAAMLACPELSPDGAPREPYTGIEVGFSHVHLTASATWDFVEDTVGELARRTHGRFLHLGGDEAHRLERA